MRPVKTLETRGDSVRPVETLETGETSQTSEIRDWVRDSRDQEEL